jgi:hypothetical protein
MPARVRIEDSASPPLQLFAGVVSLAVARRGQFERESRPIFSKLSNEIVVARQIQPVGMYGMCSSLFGCPPELHLDMPIPREIIEELEKRDWSPGIGRSDIDLALSGMVEYWQAVGSVRQG